MATTGDYYVVTLKKSHLEWGTHRYTRTRGDVVGEGYLPIPQDVSRRLGILNSNGTNGGDELGKNLFRCRSDDGFFKGNLKAQGCNYAGSIYAKQFAGDGDLQAIGQWFAHVGAREGTRVRIEWVSSTDILLSVAGSRQALGNPQEGVPTSKDAVIRPAPLSTIAETPKPKPRIIPVSVGDSIIHKVWGLGKVYEVDKQYLRVSFDNVGEKSFINPDAFEKGFIRKAT